MNANRIALGTVQFGMDYGVSNLVGQVPSDEARRMLALAASSGIDTIDTAILYGKSEYILGGIGVSGFNVISKLPAVPEHCTDIADWVQKEVAGSLNRLGIESLYGLLLHRPTQLLSSMGGDLLNGLQRVKAAGLIKRLGVSIYSPDELELIIGRFLPDLVQAPLNLVDRRLHQSGWMGRLKDRGVEIHTRSAFLQGLLLMDPVPEKFAKWSELWDTWRTWLRASQITALQACLDYPMSLPEVDRVVIGADGIGQLEQIVAAANNVASIALPNLSSEDEKLINPSNWLHL